MDTLLERVRTTNGKLTTSICGHDISGLCGGCYQMAYCGSECQRNHWIMKHEYECIGGKTKKREWEEGLDEQIIPLEQLGNVWNVIEQWLDAADLKAVRGVSVKLEKDIRRAYFARFRVRLTQESFQEINKLVFPYITKVDDSQSGGSLALELSRTQGNKALKDVRISRCPQINWNSVVLLTNVTHLDLSENELIELPDSFAKLVNLTWLNLHDNELEDLPENIGGLAKLTQLRLSHNSFTKLPMSIIHLVNLTHLDLTVNELTTLPESIGGLVNLTQMDLSMNELMEIPESIGNLTNLTVLDLSDNQVTEIPESIGKINTLTYLNVGYNQLTGVPESIGNLVNLFRLELNDNQLVALPESIGQLVKVKFITVESNQLAEVPDSVGQLVSLTQLDLSDNQLTDVQKLRLRTILGQRVVI